MEIWKDIKGYEGIYQISTLGNVKRLESKYPKIKEHLLHPSNNGTGYYQVTLTKDKKHTYKYIHRLVAETFIKNYDKSKIEINHIDENKSNNIVSNLEWCSKSYNINYGNRNTKAILKQIKPIAKYDMKHNLIEIYCSFAEAFRQTHIYNINSVCKHLRNSAGGYIWEYVTQNEYNDFIRRN